MPKRARLAFAFLTVAFGACHVLILYLSAMSRSSILTDDDAFMVRMEASYESLRQRIRRTCSKFGRNLSVTPSTVNARFRIAYLHGLAYCRNSKVGSCTWRDHLLTLSNLSKTQQEEYRNDLVRMGKVLPKLFPLNEEDRDVPMDIVAEKKSLLKIAFVRHPFERLASAFDNKIALGKPEAYEELRRTLRAESASTNRSLFSAFIRHVIWQNRNCLVRGNRCNGDGHWRPFYKNCGFCDVTYDVIGRLETFDEDVRYVVLKLNLSSLIATDRFALRKNPTLSDGGTRWKRYFQDVEGSDFQALVKIYQPDFEMFGYSYL